ncbi:MAG: sulfotransferase domain-containing protein [Clostridia bacterium]
MTSKTIHFSVDNGKDKPENAQKNMQMNNDSIITTTGFYDTGSSAVYVLLKEYESCTEGIMKNSDVEHLMMYTPNGLFDLEDKLLLGNNIHRSDEALRSFYEEMRRLNDNNFVWFGNYSKKFGPVFMEAVDDFIENLTDIKLDCNWSYDYLTTKFSFKHTLGSIKNVLTGRQAVGDFTKSIVYRKKDCTRYSYVTDEEFYSAAKNLVQAYCSIIRGGNEGKLIMDHFLLPNNLYRMDNYFHNMKVILVDRDPRDVFVHAVEESSQKGFNTRIPTDVDNFIILWKKLRNSVKSFNSENVLTLSFEDLIYKYEKTVKKIEDFCDLNPQDHVLKMQCFSVEKSKKNTQMFLKYPHLDNEIKKIERELSDYLYDFPSK